MKIIKSITLLLFCCNCFFHATAQNTRFSYKSFTNGKGDTLHYRLLEPDYDTSRKYPLVLFLHGSGERGNDNESQLKWGVQNFSTDEMMETYPVFVVAPQCPQGIEWANNTTRSRPIKMGSTPSKPMELTIALIRQIIKTMPIDTNRIYITGLSMGGIGTYDAIERYPNLFAAAVPVCGYGDTSAAKLNAHIPIWIFHGAEDPAVDLLCANDMLQALLKANAHPGFTLYPETGHFSWLKAYTEKNMYEWLFRQHKN